MSQPQQNAIAAIEATRSNVIAHVNRAFDDLVASLTLEARPNDPFFKTPTLQDGHDPRNKVGHNLTPRGVEIIYRVFDSGGGYNRAAKMLNISQGAAKNRKGCWLREGGLNRKKAFLDIDMPGSASTSN